jgi:hypothetical protein
MSLFLEAARDAPEACASLTARWGDLRRPPTGLTLFDPGGHWQLFRAGDAHVFRFRSAAYGSGDYREARFEEGFTRGVVTLHHEYFDGGRAANPLEYPLDELWMTNLLARGRGVEVHALGIRDADGRGHLFLGHSGAGKSTMARLWEAAGALILSDDRIILRRDGDAVWMYGTPWHGEARLAAAERTRVDRIFIIGHGNANALRDLVPAPAVGELFARSFVPFYDAGPIAFTLDFLHFVAGAVPCAALSFVPDPSIVAFARNS